MKMKLSSALVLLAAVAVGCNKPADLSTVGAPSSASSDAVPSGSEGSGSGAHPRVALQDGVAALTADNTAIRFVGTKPDGTIQRGSFGEVAGSIEVGGAAVKAVSVEIKTESLTAGIDRLTTHLKSADFFSVKEHPTASFTSTSVAGSMVTGELTMLGKTNEISFPVTATVTGEGLSLTADFKIDRLQFGMNYGEGDIDKEVTLNVAVGAGSGEPAEGEGASE